MIKLFAAFTLVAATACNNARHTAATNKEPASASAMNTIGDQQPAEGWQLLFDGKSTTGWHRYGGGSIGTAWQVADGTLHLDTAKKAGSQAVDGGDIVTDESFENFDLKLEWRIAQGGNSGILFYVQDDSAKYQYPWYTAPEMQVLDNEGHPDAKIIKHRAGDLYDLITSSRETVNKYGEWNSAEIKCVNGKLDLYLNGENVVSTQMWDAAWKKLVADSKFAKMTDFAMFKSGHIGLQDHGNMVWYRNVMIKRL